MAAGRWVVMASTDGPGAPPGGSSGPPGQPPAAGGAAPDPEEPPREGTVEVADQEATAATPQDIPAPREPQPTEGPAVPEPAEAAPQAGTATPEGSAPAAAPPALPPYVEPSTLPGIAAVPGAQPGARPTGPAPTGAYPTAPYPQYPGQYPQGPHPTGQFPPGGPPPGQYGTPPYPPAGPPRGRRKKVVALVAAVALLVAAGAVGIFFYERSTRTVALLAADEPGDDPFTPTLVQSGTLVPTAPFDAAANRTPAGNLDGLYFDAFGSSGCNRAQLESVLGGDPALAAAWATPLGIAGPGVPAYLAALTPVRLRADVRVTAHGNGGATADPYPAIMQAGSAVLVDDRGMPRVRCADGAPLSGAQPMEDPYYGGGWDGFNPEAMLEVRPAPAPIVEFGLVDTAGEQPLRRPAGTTGEQDVSALPGTGRLDGSYVLTGAQTRCDGLQDCARAALLTFVPKFTGCPAQCVVSDRELGDAVALTKDGDIWRASGTVPTARRVAICQGAEVPYAFVTTFTVTDSKVIDGVWKASRVKADHEVRANATGACSGAFVAWTINGVGG